MKQKVINAEKWHVIFKGRYAVRIVFGHGQAISVGRTLGATIIRCYGSYRAALRGAKGGPDYNDEQARPLF